jgi:transposase
VTVATEPTPAPAAPAASSSSRKTRSTADRTKNVVVAAAATTDSASTASEESAAAAAPKRKEKESSRAPEKTRRKHLSLEEKVAIIAANSCGRCCAEIAEQFGRDASTVSRFLRSYAATGSLESKPGRGMKRKTSDDDDGAIERLLEAAAKADGSGGLPSRLTSKDVLNALPGLGVSERTVRRRIAELGGGRKRKDSSADSTASPSPSASASAEIAPSATAEL